MRSLRKVLHATQIIITYLRALHGHVNSYKVHICNAILKWYMIKQSWEVFTLHESSFSKPFSHYWASVTVVYAEKKLVRIKLNISHRAWEVTFHIPLTWYFTHIVSIIIPISKRWTDVITFELTINIDVPVQWK